MTIGKRIKTFRHEILGLKQEDFAKTLFLSQPYLSKIESGEKEIPEQIIFLLCTIYNLNIQWIKFGTGSLYNTGNELFNTMANIYHLSNEDIEFISYYVNASSEKKETLRKLHRLFEQ